MKKGIFILLLFTDIASVSAQNYRYLVKFKDKANSPFSINQPLEFLSLRSIERRSKQGIQITENDLPPNPSYISAIQNAGALLIYKTRWMNGALIQCNETTKNNILNLSFVAGIEFNAPLKQVRLSKHQDKFGIENSNGLNYGDATAQIQLLGVDSMHNGGFHGENMLIGILDNGFLNASTITCLQTSFSQNHVKEIYDFVSKDSSVFTDGGHGTNVMSCISGYVSNSLIAPAFNADFVLYRTEDNNSESRVEEAYWLFGAERADSIGVDIINSSLGYSEFDNPADNYLSSQMDGNTALSTRAADLAASKGIVLVNSAGNSGNDPWHIITAPADGDSVLAIGATNRSGIVISFSSRGSILDSRTKPDVMAVGYQTALCDTGGNPTTSDGTSFSSPLTAGMIAGLWQANPHLTAFEISDCVRKSGSIYQNPNVNYGYGLANFVRADSVAKAEYEIKPIVSNNDILSFEFSPSNPANLNIHLSGTITGNNIRYSIIDFNSAQLIYQKITLNAGSFEILELPINEITPTSLLRIEDVSQRKTLGVFRF